MSKKSLRIAFMGTPAFSVPALDALVQAGHEVVCVYSQPPRPAGRGQKLQPSPVQQRAEELGIETRYPTSLKTTKAQAAFAALNLDAAVVVAYGLILPPEILEAPTYGCLNIHASLLPRWRGAAPIQRAILAGDTETGIGIMQMDAGLDTGDVLLEERTPITGETTATTLHDTLSEMGARMIVTALDQIDSLTPQPQTEEGMTYAKMLSRDDGRVDWSQPATQIERQIRALSPWPGVWCEMQGERLKIHAAEIIEASGTAGEVLDKDLTVACGDQALRLTQVQPAGKQPMDGKSFMNGGYLSIGDCLT